MSLLGFGSSLTFLGCEFISPAEYGTPHATFKVNGKITDQNNVGIENIKVSMEYDTSFTDKDGEYNLETSSFPTRDTFRLTFVDIDGNNNGSYYNADTLISFENIEYENGDDSWYAGEKTKEIIIKLQEKN